MDKIKVIYTQKILITAFFISVGFLMAGIVLLCNSRSVKLEREGYEGILYSNYDLTYFAEEDFLAFRGMKVYTGDKEYADLNRMVKVMKRDCDSHQSLRQIYICLHPEADEEAVDGLIDVIKNRNMVTFEILLSAPRLKSWAALSEEERLQYTDAAEHLLDGVADCQNVYVYYVGSQEWLIANPDNYETEMGFNEVIADKMLCAAFCDRSYQVRTDTFAEQKELLFELCEAYEAGKYVYPDLSDCQIVFLGDSIMGNYEGSYSIPGMVAGLTGAETFNCGEGGVSAAKTPDSKWSAYRMAAGFTDEKQRPVSEKGQYAEGVGQFLGAFDDTKHTVIFVEYGINDFLRQTPVGSAAAPQKETDYYGSLYMAIERLQQDYPLADICILTPTYVLGVGEGEKELDDYVSAAGAVADDLGVSCIDMNTCLGMTKEEYGSYLEDECHLNEKGRLAYAKVLIGYLALTEMVHE